MEAVLQNTVDCTSCMNWMCMSMLPGPTGTAMAPAFSQPSWNPMPAVQMP